MTSEPRQTPRGVDLLHDPMLNKGTAFTMRERDQLGLRGLLPPRVSTESEQELRILENFNRLTDPLDKYVYLSSLHDRNETLFYRILIDHIREMMPIVYTPTVGEACRKYGHIYRRSRGLFISIDDRGRIDQVLRNWPEDDVRIIVVTDGERILGLGDLGANGMGIPVGKLALYSACAGIHPRHCLPVTIDVGTNNEELLRDPLYLGVQRRRVGGEAYDGLLDEFVCSVMDRYPHALIQFEDFATRNAFRLLRKYRDRVRCFNDDIQGTASVALAGLYTGLRIAGGTLRDKVLVFAGAGEAAVGTADLVVSAMVRDGLEESEALRRCWFVDSRGLVVKQRQDLANHKIRFAQDHPPIADLHDVVRTVRPSALIGFSGQGRLFTRAVVEAMAESDPRPMIFALSNPLTQSECTAEEAYTWSRGNAIFASGSPFCPVDYGNRRFVPGQGNNSYIFPGVGLGVVVTGARRVVDEMFSAAAVALADQVSDADLGSGCIYPPLETIRDVSAAIAAAVAKVAFDLDLSSERRPSDLLGWVKARMFEPDYRDYV